MRTTLGRLVSGECGFKLQASGSGVELLQGRIGPKLVERNVSNDAVMTKFWGWPELVAHRLNFYEIYLMGNAFRALY